MRSIGLKIFLGFWLTHALIFVVLGLLPDKGPDQHRFERDVRAEASIAAVLHSSGGSEACRGFLHAIQREQGTELALFDASGQPLCGPPASPALTRLAAAPAPAGATDDDRQRQLVLAVTAPGGATYTAAAISGPPHGGDRPFPTTFLVVAVLASGLVCVVLTWYLTTPIQAMRRATRKLAAGDLDARAGSQVRARTDEIGQLVRDFDGMAERIESLIESQKQLLSDISHELRSPLARLQVALELARRKAGPGAEADLSRIQAEADRMTDLIARLLSVSKAESDALTRRVETFALADVVRAITEDADYEAREDGKAVALRIEQAPTVNADPALISSAIENVVRNALRHTAEGTSVEVVLTGDAGHARITVRDHGPGVPEAALKDIFSPFYRVGTARDRESGGAGLGLSISRRAVTIHGGTIRAENAPEGGLIVTIELPVAPGATRVNTGA